RGGRAVAAEDAVRAERDVGRDAVDAARGEVTGGADDAGDVRAVALAVVGDRVGVRHGLVAVGGLVGVEVVTDEVPAGDDLGGRERRRPRRAAAPEVRVVDVDAGVHDGDLD